MRIVRKDPRELNASEAAKLYRLTFPDVSVLHDDFKYIRQESSKTEAYVFIAYEGDKVIGWALVERQNGSNKGPYSFMEYVRKSYRTKGIGKRIFLRAMKFIEKQNIYWRTAVYQHDVVSEEFFKRMKKISPVSLNML